MAFNYEFPYVDPNLYNDDWLLSKMKELLIRMEEMEVWKTEYEQAYEDYKKMIEDIESGTFPDSIVNAFTKWMMENAINLVGALIKHVYFGLTNDGYFCAFIPDNWSDIHFDTISDADSELYGHLLLMYD